MLTTVMSDRVIDSSGVPRRSVPRDSMALATARRTRNGSHPARPTAARRSSGAASAPVHTGLLVLVELEPSGAVNEHLHSTEQSFYVLRGQPLLTVAGRTYRLGPNDCGLLPVGVPHAWAASSEATGDAAWLEMNCARAADLSWPSRTPSGRGGRSRDSRTSPERSTSAIHARTDVLPSRAPGEMDVDKLKIGAPVDAPTVSASMATALLAYSGIAVKMLVDQRLGAVLHTMFMVEYQPGGAAQPARSIPFEETYYLLDGEV